MRLTSKGRYAVTAILDIALNGETTPVSLAEIAERQAISLSYLEQLFAQLRREGIVKSVRGPGGGYQLDLPCEKINVGMVIAAVNENIDATRCKGNGNCHKDSRCLTHTLWERLENQIEAFLHTITFADLVKEHLEICDENCSLHHHI